MSDQPNPFAELLPAGVSIDDIRRQITEIEGKLAANAERLEKEFPDCRFLAWTPGLDWDAVAGLRACGFAAGTVS